MDLSRWLGTMWQHYVQEVAANRHLSAEQLVPPANVYLQKLKNNNGHLAQYALTNKLVDLIAAEYRFWDDMRREFKLDKITLENASFYNRKVKPPVALTDANIAVVQVNGTIVDDDLTNEGVGSKTVVEQLRKAR